MGPQTNDCYKSISAPSEGIYKEKGSKFLAFAYPVESEAQIKDLISRIKKEYFDARHHCYAYRLRHDYSIWRANDDGEPSSSAGRPILGQILSNELSDILIVVVRYFGGIKKTLKDFGLYPHKQDFDNMCTIETKVRLRDEERFVEAMVDKGSVSKIEQTTNNIEQNA